jgi:tetratricopeptide (TPR) repeat protein
VDGADSPLTMAADLLRQAEQSADPRDASQVIGLLEGGKAADRYPDAGATYWTVLGMAYYLLFERTGDGTALRESVSAFRTVADGIARADPRWPSCASNLANTLVDVFAVTGSAAALTEAVALLRAARAAMPPDDPNLPTCLLNLGRALIDLARTQDESAVWQEAIAVLREAEAASGSDADPALLSNLGNALAEDGVRSGEPARLAEAVTMFGDALALTPPGSPYRYVHLTNLGNALTGQFEITGDRLLLDRAVAAHRDALAALSAGAADTASCLSNLAKPLVRRYEFTGDPDALAEAVAALREAVALTPQESAGRAPRLLNLGTALSTRFARSGQPDDLNEAIAALREALAGLPRRHAERPTAQSALGEALTRSFELTGDPARLEEAVRLLRESVAGTGPEHWAFGLRLFNLAGALMRRFEHVRHLATLDEAIEVARHAVQVTPDGHPSHAMRLSGLGSALDARHIHSGGEQDLADAIAAHRRAVTVSKPDDPQRGIRLSSLGIALLRAYLASQDRIDLDDATTALRTAVSSASDDDPNRAGFRSNLANALRQRFDLDGQDSDADEAVDLLELAAQDAGPGHPNQGAYQFNLGAVHRSRFRHGGDPGQARKAAMAFLAGARAATAPSLIRATAAVNAGRIAAEAGLASIADEGFSAAVGLLGRLAWRGLPRVDQEELLRRFAGVASDAAAWALERGDRERAVELVEQGRGVLLAQAIDARAPRAILHDAAPDLADRLTRIDTALDRTDVSLLMAEESVPADTSASRAVAESRMALASERDAVVAEITAAGMGGLVAPARFEDLRQAARDGPVVVINVSRYRCDALTVTTSGVRPIGLDITAEDIDRRVVAFVTAVEQAEGPTPAGPDGDPAEEILDWLFHQIAEPVLRDLGLTAPRSPRDAPRLWWCPTGLLSFLPLHAARARRGGTPAVLDRVASSYTPTIRALLHARTRPPAQGATPPRALVVSIPATPGYAVLPGAAREAAMVRRRLPHAEVLSGQDATTQAVSDALNQADWIHLACHGEQDLSSPSEGRLLMYDGALTARQLARHRVPHGRLAMLSACETVRGGVELADEAITLASAIQLAGFHHVIGTLWAVGDAVAARFVDAVYGRLSADRWSAEQSARGVHLTLWELRARYASPRAWATFVHAGP